MSRGAASTSRPDLLLQQLRTFCGERCRAVPGSVGRFPHVVTGRRLDGTQHELRHDLRALSTSRGATSLHGAMPDHDVQLTQRNVIAALREPRNADGVRGSLKHTSRWRAMLLDRSWQLLHALQ